MIIKKISNNPLINADRWATVDAVLTYTGIELRITTDYRDENECIISHLPKKSYQFSTDGHMVDPTTGQPAQLVDVVDENNEVVGKDRATGSVSEFQFFKSFPANAFNDTALWDRVKKLIEARIQSLDAQGLFTP